MWEHIEPGLDESALGARFVELDTNNDDKLSRGELTDAIDALMLAKAGEGPLDRYRRVTQAIVLDERDSKLSVVDFSMTPKRVFTKGFESLSIDNESLVLQDFADVLSLDKPDLVWRLWEAGYDFLELNNYDLAIL